MYRFVTSGKARKLKLENYYPFFLEDEPYSNSNQDCSEHWSNWSLHQFMRFHQVIPKFPTIQLDYKIYLTKILSWIQFTTENSERLKCRFCGKLMNFDPNYTRNSSNNDISVFHCPESDPTIANTESALDGSTHNRGVYINHCWGCKQTIDNRDSLKLYGIKHYREGSWYRCINNDCQKGAMHK